MDGAWALFEAWVRLQIGDIDVALVAGSGKSSPGKPREIFPLQTDPYVAAPLGLDPVSVAGLQARALLDAGLATERDFAEVVSRSRRDALANPNAQVKKDVAIDALLKEPYYASPLRKHDLPPISDGAAAVLIARGDRARELTKSPVWIRAIDHRIDSHHLGLRDLTDSPSTRIAAEGAGAPRRADRRGRAVRALQPRGDRAARALELSPGTTRQPLRRPALRPSGDGDGPRARDRGGAADPRRRARAAASRTRRAAPRCNRTCSASSKEARDGRALRRRRHRTDQVRAPPRRRLARRARARGGAARARGRATSAGRTSTPS